MKEGMHSIEVDEARRGEVDGADDHRLRRRRTLGNTPAPTIPSLAELPDCGLPVEPIPV